tara:strand:- start:94 stop:714 length:621 start_codon:yes stop_codon:yes gene_type:complete
MYKKLIIAFEGIEGSGKSLHLKNLSNYLNKKKISFIKLREPGGSKNAEIIRSLILNKKSTFDKKTDLLLYLAARNENMQNIIKKNYKKKVILIDRFIDSTYAYQHYGMGLNKNIIKILNSYIVNKLKVDFTFLHIVNQKNLKKRLSKRKVLNRYDKFSISFYNNVQKGFLNLANKNKKKYLKIISDKNININKKIIINKTNQILKI